jgi:hypothetical protein
MTPDVSKQLPGETRQIESAAIKMSGFSWFLISLPAITGIAFVVASCAIAYHEGVACILPPAKVSRDKPLPRDVLRLHPILPVYQYRVYDYRSFLGNLASKP